MKEENSEKFLLPENKEVYSFDDILNMKIDGKKYVINKELGEKEQRNRILALLVKLSFEQTE